VLKKYDPEVGAPASAWLAADETRRIDLVRAYHRRAGVRLPNERLHAAIHVIVENQLALGEEVVVLGVSELVPEQARVLCRFPQAKISSTIGLILG
jgi:hypothetical protein